MYDPLDCRRSDQGTGRHGQLAQEMGRLEAFYDTHDRGPAVCILSSWRFSEARRGAIGRQTQAQLFVLCVSGRVCPNRCVCV